MSIWKWSLLSAAPCMVALGVFFSREEVAPPAMSDAAEQRPPGRPRVELDRDAYEFGVMDVGETRRHIFTIRNAGDADLRIRSTGTSCKCALLNGGDGRIAPGAEQPVEIEWRTLEAKEHYRQGGVLETNDPERPQIILYVEGKVQAKFITVPESVVFSDLREGEGRSQRVLVVSQSWPQFTLPKIESPLELLECTVRPADPSELEPLHALSGYELELTLKPGLSRGTYHHKLRVTPDAPTDPRASALAAVREIPVLIDVVSDYSLHGRAVEGTCMQLGNVLHGSAKQERVYLLARGDAVEADIREIRTQPEFVRVTVAPDPPLTGKVRRYVLDVAIPADAPRADYTGVHVAQVELHTTHPRTPVVRFQVQFAVY